MNLLARPRQRRGMLLLLVLTMLALFVMLGAFLLVTAIRSRAAARAFASATQGAAVDGMQARALLDEALLIAVRGTKNASPVSESILGDKYGPVAGNCNVTLAYDAAAPLLAAPISGFTLSPRAMFGRVLTLSTTSSASDAERGLPVSFRIVGASSGSASTVLLANAPVRPGLRLPAATGTYTAVINGREFAVEPWDGYDDANMWLAQPVLKDGQVERFKRVSFGGTTSPTVDNDNDGVADGIWLSGVLPDRPSPGGGRFSYRVSYLILDLDGRININACPIGGGFASGTTTLGMGYGPADVDAGGLLTITAPPPSPPLPPPLSGAGGLGFAGPLQVTGSVSIPIGGSGGGLVTTSAGGPSPDQRRPPPGVTVVGRLGQDGYPGALGDQVSGYQQTISSAEHPGYGQSLYLLTVAGTNAVADLEGRAAVSMVAPTGSATMSILCFDFGASGIDDGVDDPYEVRLDTSAPRLTVAATAAGLPGVNDDNPYAAADMERLLRANDADAAALPQRLAAATGTMAQRLRMRVTTDSWDTPAITGDAAARVEDYLTGAVPAIVYPWQDTNPVSPDVAAGLRFNLNRPVRSGTTLQAVAEQQEYCKGLYTLVRAFGGVTAPQAAQWAANVLDFRDDDSRMTRFVYDTNLADGWSLMDPTTTGTVFGIEKPQVLIAETAAWSSISATGTIGQVFVNLHRPFRMAIVTSTSGTWAREVLARELATGADLSNLNIADVTGTFSGTAIGVWQLRYDRNKVAKFHAVPGGSGSEVQWSQTMASGTPTVTGTMVEVVGATGAAPPLAGNGHLCVHSPAPTFFTVNVPGHAVGSSGSTGFTQPVDFSVTLERLADPTRPNGHDNPYVVVDTARVDVINVPDPLTPPPPSAFQKRRRPGPTDATVAAAKGLGIFWNNAGAWEPGPLSLTTYSGASAAKPIPWLHWPNRPFVSAGELALVPSDFPAQFLSNYAFPTTSLAAGPAALAQRLLDAVHVPSRFAGTSLSLNATSGTEAGLDLLRAGQMASWREPGRVNVNTIVSGTAAADADSLVWSTLVGGTARQFRLASGTVAVPFTPFNSSGTAGSWPAGSLAQLLSLSNAAGQPLAGDVYVSSGTGLHPRDNNPFLAHATAIRLANTATIRSQVFAVWITLETTDSADGSTTYHRLFAIVDRSIPVGFREGENLNVRDTIRLQRYLE